MGRSNKKTGKCHLCGIVGALSREHIPPKKAFNDCTVLLKRMVQDSKSETLQWFSTKSQGGVAAPVLCGSCNNCTGSWYAAAYVDLVRACAPFATPLFAGGTARIELANTYPLHILKQVLVMFAGVCGAGFVERQPGLRDFLLSRENPRPSPGLRVFPYLRCQFGGRASGVTGVSDFQNSSSAVIAEVSRWPMGWVLVVGDEELPGGQDIMNWCRYAPGEHAEVSLRLPVHWTPTAFPGDFRPPQQSMNEIADNRIYLCHDGKTGPSQSG